MSLKEVLWVGIVLSLCTSLGEGNKEEETVNIWAQNLGDELWQLGMHVSKYDTIISSYSTLNARVLPTNGESILNSIVEKVSKMLKRKMDAVMCIIEAAEALAEEAETNVTRPIYYNSAKCSSFIDEETGDVFNSTLTSCKWEEEDPTLADEERRPSNLYKNITVSPDPNFFNIPVNTHESAVHMPTDVYDYLMPVQSALKWSEELDAVFRQNYEGDPTLKWQYFGSNTGFLRMYPAIQWKKEEDVYDCRKAPWFIEASTCSKDVVILFDRSGSMKGMSDSIAKLTINQLLSTFSNNDFINILGFNTLLNVHEMVPCFTKDKLVQATEENIRTFMHYVNESQPENKANFSTAFIAAFNLLQQYRETETCPDKTCNQAIMLITDSVADNMTEVFELYNWFENRTHIPVRVFTYLIGREVTKVREIQWMACLNRGYYVHIQGHSEVRDKILKYIPVIARPLVLQAVDHPLSNSVFCILLSGYYVHIQGHSEVRDKILKYIPVIARPLVLQAVDHPLSWTHVFIDFMGEEDGGLETTFCEGFEKVYEEEEFNIAPKMQEYRLMTSVSGPAFDHKINRGNESREAQLLGVAGSDIPVKHIEKLTLPYKIGANGYAFMITNNGYLVFHPDFRPVHQGKLRTNYNSVDLTEVELMDDDNSTPREPHEKILELRQAMINHTGGQISNISHLRMKFPYDDMRRVGSETRNYYFSGIKGTPFTIGLALPEGYGNYWIKAGNIIKRTKLEGVPLTSFFSGNWKIHPDWVYCDHYITRKNMSPEEKLVYFLKKIYQEKTDTPDGGWKSKLQFPAEEDLQVGNMTYGCNKHKIKRDDYFCDVELMQLLVFDAKSTDSSYKDTVWTPENNIERDLVKKYGVSVRFVATQSGLTRWQHITELPPDQLEFGETNNKAVGEAWYRSAVLQHYINDEDFVFSVPFDSGKVENLTVTASYAIFRRDGGHEAPGSVVGFHLSHSALFDRFREVTSKSNCKDCLAPCSSDTIDCYVIDGNGYIVVSENREETGTFFGVKEGAIMEDMTSKKIFRKIPMFDYQAICFEVTHYNNAADVLLTPFRLLHWLVKSFVSTIAWLIVESNWNHVWAAITERSSEEDVLDYYDPQQTETLDVTTTSLPKIDVRTVKSTRTCRSCDKSGYRYLLQSTDKQADRSYSHEDPCYRPYFVRRIPHTNLLLIVVKALFPTCSKESTTEFKEELYLAEPDPKIPCVKLYLNTLPRRRLAGCYNEHPQELEIENCGRGGTLTVNSLSWLLPVWLLNRFFL
ncbi:voltage-dependent calcium channel subunit alpha-2/delta-4-like isoform X2 [Homalodisca vitripennis]|uniref:voltage-dependent calcium channel subunit alpha-2/delta-4-like isoform X2 n=1 Tax=Homalodisca vitripennis TaxID=197043 RepID=UPI001EEAA5AF|nr:voltage-dependent calcium channel subunit alpha-2/delta-4-like isoform X2 [Homalodisca vitripennis]